MANLFKYHTNLFHSAFNSDDTSFISSDAERRQLLLHLMIFTGVVFLFIFGILAVYQGLYLQGIADIVAAIILYILDFNLKKRERLILITRLFVIVLAALFMYLVLIKSDSLSGHLWSFMVPISVIFLLRGKTGLITTLIFITVIDVFFIFDYPPGQYDLYFKLRYTGVFLAITVISYFLELVRDKTQISLESKNRELDATVIELNRKEKELEVNSRQYRLLFEDTNDAIIIMEGSRLIDFNARALEMFGYSREEFAGLSVFDLSPQSQPCGSDSKSKAIEYFRTARKKNNIRFEWLHRRKNSGLFTADIILHVMNNNRYFATLRDIDYLKETEKQLIEAKEAAEKSERIKSEFLAQMSHEIRTPINAILNFSSLLKSELNDKIKDEDVIAFSAIENSASRLMRTIDLILNVAEVESGTIAPVFSKIDLVKEAIIPILKDMKGMTEDKNLELIFENKIQGPVLLNLDQYSINQSISNIIDNAIKYTDEGQINILLYKSGENIVLDIIDSGIGISKEYLPNLFDKFSQEQQGYSRSFEGNGLGLALVKEYCKINNVDVQVESTKGYGSKFSLIFPPASN